MKRLRISRAAAVALLLVLILAVAATVAVAQNGSNVTLNKAAAAQAAPPTPFLTIHPEAGFPLDPFLVSLQGGGAVAASTLSKECKGFVPAAPTVTFDFKGDADLLKAFFYSDGDTVLVVQTPDSKYLCADDTNAVVLDPTIEIAKPAQGVYNVWVGSAKAQDLVPGFLVVTSHGDMSAGALSLGNLVKRQAVPAILPVRQRLVNAAKRLEEARAAIKTIDALKAGGKPVVKAVAAKGVLPAAELQPGDTLCGGLVNITPDYAFDWTGSTKALSLLAEADADTTLLVLKPDGSFACADDADGAANVNPLLTLSSPVAGRYLAWIGRVDPSKPVSATLTLTEAAGVQPKALPKQ